MNRRPPSSRRRTGLLVGMLALAGMALLTPGAWRHHRLPGLIERAGLLAPEHGLRWLGEDGWTADAPVPLPREAVLLVHGLDEPGGIWDALAPRLAGAGHAVARFDYPNDQPVGPSADGLIAALAELRRSGVATVRIVGHSMGGLLARDALTRPGADRAALPGVPLLVTVGTPHGGSAWAGWQPAAELREQVQRWIESDDRDAARLFGAWHDGLGGAAADLMPGSAFLTDLNARPAPAGTRIVCVVGVLLTDAAPLPEAIDGLGARAAALGDGVVSAGSAALPGAAETLLVRGNHRSILRPVELDAWARRLLGVAPAAEPPAVELILERLGGKARRH